MGGGGGVQTHLFYMSTYLVVPKSSRNSLQSKFIIHDIDMRNLGFAARWGEN